MPLYLSDLNADTPPFLTTPFLKSSLSDFLASGRILALFVCDLAFGPAPHTDTLNALFAKANYAADFKVQVCGSTFPVIDNWLTFLPSATACVDVPWVFTVLGVLVWFVGLVCLLNLVLNLVLFLSKVVWLVVYFALESFGRFGYWAVGVLGGWLGMREEVVVVRKEVPVVVVNQ